MNEMKPLADTRPADVNRTLEEALAEVEREINVRLKCFDRWVSEGRLSRIEARDRLERMMAAYNLLGKLGVTSSGDLTEQPVH